MYGFNPTNFNDSYNPTETLVGGNRERAKLLSQSFLTDSELGGKAIGIYGQNKAEDIMAKANASVQRTQNNAAGISGLLSAAGSIGSFGAAGGFGGAGAVGGDGGAAAGLTTPWDKGYDYFKDAPSFMGEGFSMPSYDFTSPFTN